MAVCETMTAHAAHELLARPNSDRIGPLAREGARWTFGLIIGRHATSMCATAILARVLTSTDYGLMGMVVTLTAFFQIFSDLGLSWLTVQKHDLTREQLDNLFWLNATGGALFWAACAASGTLLNRFYGRSELSGIAAVLGAGFLLAGVAVQPAALLRRQMRLKTLALCESVSQAAGALVGVALALAGYGYWALVGQSLVAQLVVAALLFWGSGYAPRQPASGQAMSKMLGFGGYLSAFAVVTYFARNLDNVLIGRYCGAEQLGYYSRAYFLMMLPAMLAAGALSGVMVPALSALAHDRTRMSNAYCQSLRAIGTIGFPVAVGFMVTAPEIVRLVYGPRWLPVVPLLMWLSLASVTQPVYLTISWLYIPCGKARELFLWGLLSATVLAIAFVFGIRSGPRGVAIAYGFVMTFGLTVPALYFAHRAARIQLLPSLLTLVRPLAASIAMGLVVWLSGQLVMQFDDRWQLALCIKVATGVVIYTAISGPRTVAAALIRP